MYSILYFYVNMFLRGQCGQCVDSGKGGGLSMRCHREKGLCGQCGQCISEDNKISHILYIYTVVYLYAIVWRQLGQGCPQCPHCPHFAHVKKPRAHHVDSVDNLKTNCPHCPHFDRPTGATRQPLRTCPHCPQCSRLTSVDNPHCPHGTRLTGTMLKKVCCRF